MASHLPQLLLGLLAANLGMALGAGLYESRIQIPQWLIGSRETGYRWNRAAAVEADVGLRFWALVTTLPLTLLFLAALSSMAWIPMEVRPWHAAALGTVFLERAMTFGYFIPTMVRLMQEGRYDAAQSAAKALRWVRLGYVRTALTALALGFCLAAFAQAG